VLTHYVRDTSKFDSHLYTDDMNAKTNARFMLRLRVFLKQGPVGSGVAPGGFDSLDWDAKAWESFKKKFKADVQSFWSGRYWLVPNVAYPEMQFSVKLGKSTATVQCNAFCELFVDLLDSANDAHRVVNIFNIKKQDIPSFPTNSSNFSQHDVKEVRTLSDDKGTKCVQRTLAHEAGHLIGLPHIGVTVGTSFTDSTGTSQICTTANQNTTKCYYAPTKTDTCSVMGIGSGLTTRQAEPWLSRIDQHTGLDKTKWTVKQFRPAPKNV